MTITRDQVLQARRRYSPVASAPFTPGDAVTVVRAVDVEVHDVRPLVGQRGRVLYLEYDCGCGQSYPSDPMVGVRLESFKVEEFWREELEKTC